MKANELIGVDLKKWKLPEFDKVPEIQPTNEQIAARLDLLFCKLDRVENELNKLHELLKRQVV